MEAFIVFAGVFALGAALGAPAWTFGDSGELAAAAATLGLPHAPSYPGQVLASRAFGGALGLGNWAYRTNLFSALCGALAAVVLWDAARRQGASRAGRLLACAALALSPLWARELGVTEVFGLHVLTCAAVLWLCAAFEGRLCSPRAAAALGLCFGLGFAGHQTLALFAPAVVLAAAWERPGASRAVRASVVFGLFFFLGAAVYLFLPLRSAAGPPLDWGQPTTWARFMRVVLRKDYGTGSLTVDGASGPFLSQAPRFFSLLWSGAPVLAALGLAGLLLKPRLAPLAAFLAAGPGFLLLGRPPVDAQTQGALDRFALAPAAALAGPAAAALTRAPWLSLGLLAGGLPPSSRWDLSAYDYGRAVLKSLPPGAALFMDGGDDTFYAVAFLQQGLGLRPDVEPHDRGGLVFKSAYGSDFRALSRSEKERRRLSAERIYAQQGRLFYSTLAERLDPEVPLSSWGLLRRAGPGAPFLHELYVERWREEDLAARYRDRALVAVYPYTRHFAFKEQGRAPEAQLALLEARALGGDALWLKRR